MSYLKLSLCLCICVIVSTVWAVNPVQLTGIGVPYAENFNSYRGTVETLPAGFFVTWDESRTSEPFTGVSTFEESDPFFSYGGFTAYTHGASNDYSFGIRERAPVDLRDARVYVSMTNMTGQAISGFLVSYDVEAWYIGDRRNRIRLKYDDQFGDGRFEEDIFSTDNPSSETTPMTKVNGALAENRTTISAFVNLATYLDPDGEPFGVLPDGAAAYFRWQFSNADGDEGSLRSGLAINNLVITPIADAPAVPTNVVTLHVSAPVITAPPHFVMHATMSTLSNGTLAIGYGKTDNGSDWIWHEASLTNATSPYIATNSWALTQPGTYYYAARWHEDMYTYYGVNNSGKTNMLLLQAEAQIVITNPVAVPLVITEVMSRSNNTNIFVEGDWFEIYNAGASDIDLTGFSWSDDRDEPGEVVFPTGIVIRAYDTLIVTDNPISAEDYFITSWDMFARTGSSNVLNMGSSVPGLGRNDDEVHLYSPEGYRITSVSFGPTTNGHTFEWDIEGNYLGISEIGVHGAWQQPGDGLGGPGLDVGSPGAVVPEPIGMGIVMCILYAVFLYRRRIT